MHDYDFPPLTKIDGHNFRIEISPVLTLDQWEMTRITKLDDGIRNDEFMIRLTSNVQEENRSSWITEDEPVYFAFLSTVKGRSVRLIFFFVFCFFLVF